MIGKLLRERSWVTAAEVWKAGGGRSIAAAGRLLSDLMRQGLVQLWRHSTGRGAATRYRLTIDGHNVLELEERNGTAGADRSGLDRTGADGKGTAGSEWTG